MGGETDTRSGTAYTEFHPRWHRSRVSTYWWLWRWPYLKFVLREMSSSFAAWYVLLTVYQVHMVSSGPQAYHTFELEMRNPAMLAINLISFVFVVWHTITWFNLTPKAMVLRLAGKRVPGPMLVAANYGAWLLLSAVVSWFILRA